MLFDHKQEKEFRKRQGIERLGEYDGVILGLGLNFEKLRGFDPSKPQAYGLESLAGPSIYKGRSRGRELVLAPTLVGAPAASAGIEIYLCHSPASEAIGVGFCGGLQPEAGIGRIVIPSRARIGEGTSKYYGKEQSSTPDEKLLRRLIDATQQCGYEPLVGEIYTIDALFMETPDFIKKLSDQGILGIDMEMSALFSIAEYHGKASAGILVVSDRPERGSVYDFQLPVEAIERITKAVIKICVKALTD